MKRDQLKPYVYKVEGAAKISLYNMMTGKFYRFTQEGDVEELRKELFKEGLIFETQGVVPSKIVNIDLLELKSKLFLRELQIRLNGHGEDNCWNRKKIECDTIYLSSSNLKRIVEMCQYLPIQKVRLEAEVFEIDKIEMVFQAFNSSDIELYVECGINTDQKDIIKKNHHGGKIRILDDGKKRIKDHKIELFPFLYSEFYNPCLGHQVAIDANGDIKCCLWFDEVLGNVEKDDLKELIIRGDFDIYWETHKMKIEGCKDCELRRVCNDCRADVINTGRDFFSKPTFCDYDPYT